MSPHLTALLAHLRPQDAVSSHRAPAPTARAAFPTSASYTNEVHRLYRKAEERILWLEKEACAKIQRQTGEALAAAHQWQRTVTKPEFKARLAPAVPEHNSVRLFKLEEAIDKMQLGTPFHWVCDSDSSSRYYRYYVIDLQPLLKLSLNT